MWPVKKKAKYEPPSEDVQVWFAGGLKMQVDLWADNFKSIGVKAKRVTIDDLKYIDKIKGVVVVSSVNLTRELLGQLEQAFAQNSQVSMVSDSFPPACLARGIRRLLGPGAGLH